MTDKTIEVWVGVSANGKEHVSTTARNQRDCKRLVAFLAVRGTRTIASWEYAQKAGFSIVPATLTLRDKNNV